MIQEHYLEKFDWQSGEDKIEIPSLEPRTVNIARENPDLTNGQLRQIYGPAGQTNQSVGENLFLGLCTNYKRIVFPREDLSAAIFVAHMKFEAELRGVLGKRRIFPKKVYGDIIFKKTGGTKTIDGKLIPVRPTTWLDLEKIRSWQMKNP